MCEERENVNELKVVLLNKLEGLLGLLSEHMRHSYHAKDLSVGIFIACRVELKNMLQRLSNLFLRKY